MNVILRASIATAVVGVTAAFGGAALADTVVQIPVDSILDGRSVSTIAAGTVTPWVSPQGVYNDGSGGAYATAAVKAKLAPTAAGEGLPDDGLFAATATLPAFQLHFSNTAPTTSPQTHQVHITTGAQSFQFAVPPATYSALFLILTASEGTANLTVTLSYAGAAPSTMMNVMLPDSGIGVQTGGSPHFYLITDTGKWNTADTDVEPTGHTIEGIQITPTATAMLTGIQIAKTNNAHLVFWGATGIATSPVDAGAVDTTDAESAGDASPAEDSSASSGASASGSASGSSGSTTSSGAVASGSSSGTVAASGVAGSGTVTGTSGTLSTTGGLSGASPGASGSAEAGASTHPTTSNKSSSGCSVARGAMSSTLWAPLAGVTFLLGWRRRRQHGGIARS
jgi:MYXO-CTERM domain-containing protein